MFEDFRKQAEEADFSDEDLEDELNGEANPDRDGVVLGMTPPQRFIDALMLLIMTIIIGSLFLIVTSKVLLPFLG